MITFRSPSAHVNYWRKSGNTCRKVHESAFGTKRTSKLCPIMSAFGGIADITQTCLNVRF